MSNQQLSVVYPVNQTIRFPEPTTLLEVDFTHDEYVRLEAAAKAEGMSVEDYIVTAVREHLDRKKKHETNTKKLPTEHKRVA